MIRHSLKASEESRPGRGCFSVAFIKKVLQNTSTKLLSVEAEHEADGIHQIALSSAIGSDDTGEIGERTDDLPAAVTLEVLELKALQLPHVS